LNTATVGFAAHGLDAISESLHKVTFAGSEAMTLPPGAPALSDPIDLPVKALSDLVVSVYVRDGVSAFHCEPGDSVDQGGVEGSDETAATHFPVDKCLDLMRPLVSEVDVLADRPRRVIVTLGDSITDGDVDPKTGERGWPGALSRRLENAKVSVANAGIGGNRLLQPLPMFGVSALSRLDRDVFAVPGVTHIVVLEGINDIRMTGTASVLGDRPMVEPQALIAAYSQIIVRAHERGIKVIGATLLPFGGAGYYTAERESVRTAVNEWIRTSKRFDGVIDFDAAMRDHANPNKIEPKYDSGDHLHPNFDGYRQMGEVIDLRLFN
jgi:lysophospholipase L1-like esterase